MLFNGYDNNDVIKENGTNDYFAELVCINGAGMTLTMLLKGCDTRGVVEGT